MRLLMPTPLKRMVTSVNLPSLLAIDSVPPFSSAYWRDCRSQPRALRFGGEIGSHALQLEGAHAATFVPHGDYHLIALGKRANLKAQAPLRGTDNPVAHSLRGVRMRLIMICRNWLGFASTTGHSSALSWPMCGLIE